MVARAEREGEWEFLFIRYRLSVLQDQKIYEDGWRWWSHNMMNVYNSTKLCILLHLKNWKKTKKQGKDTTLAMVKNTNERLGAIRSNSVLIFFFNLELKNF